MTIQGLRGKPICITLGGIVGEATDFSSYSTRFLGFYHSGDEAFGYRLVDRVGATDIETGDFPEFSDDGTMFAAIQIVDVDDMAGDFDGIGVWEVLPDRVVTRFSLDADKAPPRLDDWQIDRWVGNRCIELSAIDDDIYGRIRNLEYEAMEKAKAKLPRVHFHLKSYDGKWRFERVKDASPCFELKGLGR